MKKILNIFLWTALCSGVCYGQTPGEWTWMSAGQLNSAPVFGTKGVPGVNNHPAGLYEPANWTDAQGNFWIYGGSSINGSFYYADLWKYNPATNEWTWVFGPGTTTQVPSYGTKGVPSATNTPGCRGYGCCTWVDNGGNLWLFGGWSYGVGGEMNDTWKYDIATGQWTWISGSTSYANQGVYGTKGVPSVNNYPASRLEGPCYWQDSNNNFWLYGGEGSTVSKFSDLWKYNPATNEWTWVNGSQGAATAVYGTHGVSSPGNTPGGRQCYTHWIDKSDRLWLFGGTDYLGGNFGDMWKYDPAIDQWTWMSGSSAKASPGNYPAYCATDSTAAPAGIYENKVCWTDKCGHFWMFGGFYRNDLWEYNPATNQWKFVSGSNVSYPTGSYGTKGISSPSNLPDGRGGGSAFSDLSGNLWMFGGYASATYGDLWRYVPDTFCVGGCSLLALPSAHFFSSDTVFCSESGACIDFFNQSTGNPSAWRWFFPGATPDTSTLQNPTSICYYNPGTYSVKLIVSNSAGSDSLTISSMIIFASSAVPPVLNFSGDTIYCSHAAAYQWYLNGSPISSATDSFFVITGDGLYAVQITDGNGCTRLSNGFPVSVNELTGLSGIKIYPNPAGNELWVESFGLWVGSHTTLEIINVLGAKVLQSEIKNQKSEINISSLAEGIYLIEVSDGKNIYRAKMVKQ